MANFNFATASFRPCQSLSIFLFSSPNLSLRRLDVYHTMYGIYTRCGLSANLERRCEMCCTRLAENTRRKKSPKNRHLGAIGQLYTANATKASIDNLKNCLNSNISSAAEICWRVWGTAANFNWFRVLDSLLHRRRLTEVSKTSQNV